MFRLVPPQPMTNPAYNTCIIAEKRKILQTQEVAQCNRKERSSLDLGIPTALL
jgi:hypothetical protein